MNRRNARSNGPGRALALVVAGGLVAATAAAADTAPPPARFDAGVVSGLGARNIGSAAMSGRVAALAAVRGKDGKTTVFVGAASGGVWKSTDSGTTFRPVFDKQPVQSIGSIAIDPSNPQVVWVGTGEAWTRNSVSIGNGVYKSTDGGETWRHVGLDNSERVASILVDPHDGDTVYACVPGKLWSDSPDRGLYRSADGGNSWTLVLKGTNLSTGCASVSLDARNPQTLFAALWDFRRKGWTFRSGGESPSAASASGLFQSHDGGRSWTELTAAANAGFPAKPFGRIAVAVAPIRTGHRLCVRRIDRFGAVPVRRRRADLEPARQEPDDGLAPVLLRQPDRRSEQPRSRVQAGPGADPESRWGQELRQRGRRHPRRPSCGLDRSDRHKARDHRRRRRPVAVVGWRQQVVEAGQPADLPVLPCQRRQRRSLPRLWRPAGQQLLGGRQRLPGRHHQLALGKHVRRRWLLDVRRPRRSGLHLRRGAGRHPRSRQSPHAPDPLDPAHRRLQGEIALELEHADRIEPAREGHALYRRAVPVPHA